MEDINRRRERDEIVNQNQYTVTGMTCGHCVTAVREEVSRIPGVQSVEVDLDSGRLSVTSGGDLDPAAVRAAVEEAGYSLA